MARGFLGAVQKFAREAEREAKRQRSEAARREAEAHRQAERARKESDRARKQAARASEADRKRKLAEAKVAHVAAKEAEVESLNAGLEETYDAIDTLLAATLDVDDFFDLNTLRREAEHPPFDAAHLERRTPEPARLRDPPEPAFGPPDPPKGLFTRKKKHAMAIADAETAHALAQVQWRTQLDSLATRRKALAEEHDRTEAERLQKLGREQARYAKECVTREAEVTEHNAGIDSLIVNLGYGTVEAVEGYISIVLSHSIYPEHLPVTHDFTFDPSIAELRMRVLLPPPNEVQNVKSYRYVKKTDEIVSTDLSQKARRDRYTRAVHQVALRSLHEIFEADRRGLVRTISLDVGTETTNPATGKAGYIPFVAVGAERDSFMDFDLSAVVPRTSLEHLGAALSKNPYALVAADTSGVRRA